MRFLRLLLVVPLLLAGPGVASAQPAPAETRAEQSLLIRAGSGSAGFGRGGFSRPTYRPGYRPGSGRRGFGFGFIGLGFGILPIVFLLVLVVLLSTRRRRRY